VPGAASLEMTHRVRRLVALLSTLCLFVVG